MPLRQATGTSLRSSGPWIEVTWETASRWLGVSMKPPPPISAASRVALRTSSTVTLWARSLCGSTRAWICRSRWPQMATLATPATAMSRGRIVHLAIVVMSIWDRVFDESPIFMTRLVEDKGERMTGGLATEGRRGATWASRSWTSWRAFMSSVPSAK